MNHATSTVAPAPAREVPPLVVGRHRCGFCSTGNCQHCPGVIKSARSLWKCPCRCETSQTVRCRECKHADLVAGEVDPNTWLCLDTGACSVRRRKRYDRSELGQMMAAIARSRPTEDSSMASKPKRTTKPGTGRCHHCGQPTKGGKFIPGHDAKLKAELQKDFAPESFVEARMRGWYHGAMPEGEATKLWEELKGDQDRSAAWLAERNRQRWVATGTQTPVGADAAEADEEAGQ